jgi:hypothetical protein
MELNALINQIKGMMDNVVFQVFLGIIAIWIAVCFYFLPSGIAYARRHKYTKTVFLLNLLFGWTGLGWIILLVRSFKGNKRHYNKKRKDKRRDTEIRDIVQERLKELTQN